MANSDDAWWAEHGDEVAWLADNAQDWSNARKRRRRGGRSYASPFKVVTAFPKKRPAPYFKGKGAYGVGSSRDRHAFGYSNLFDRSVFLDMQRDDLNRKYLPRPGVPVGGSSDAVKYGDKVVIDGVTFYYANRDYDPEGPVTWFPVGPGPAGTTVVGPDGARYIAVPTPSGNRTYWKKESSLAGPSGGPGQGDPSGGPNPLDPLPPPPKVYQDGDRREDPSHHYWVYGGGVWQPASNWGSVPQLGEEVAAMDRPGFYRYNGNYWQYFSSGGR